MILALTAVGAIWVDRTIREDVTLVATDAGTGATPACDCAQREADAEQREAAPN